MAIKGVAIVGTGYVGLSTAIVLAEKRFSVTCVDSRGEIIDRLLRKECPIYECGMAEALRAVSLQATTNLAAAVSDADVVMLCVGTPTQDGSDEADLSYLEAAARQIGDVLKNREGYVTIVVKSTVPPGTTDTVVRKTLEEASGRTVGESDRDFGLATVPEFLREGAALEDSRNPGRVVLGVESRRAEMVLRELFAAFKVPIVAMNSRSAELTKYMTNSLLATLISFGNDFSNLAGILGNIDMSRALKALSYDPRWWPGRRVEGESTPEILSYLVPGPGFGGSCFPKDLRAILSRAVKSDYPLSIPRAALRLNETQGDWVARTLERVFPDGLVGRVFGIYGLAFKPDTDDVRETPSARIIASLRSKGASVRAFDPVAVRNYMEKYPPQVGIEFTANPQDLFAQTDGVILVTPWSDGLSLFYEPASYRTSRFALVYDARGRLDSSRMRTMPCLYLSPLAAFQTARPE